MLLTGTQFGAAEAVSGFHTGVVGVPIHAAPSASSEVTGTISNTGTPIETVCQTLGEKIEVEGRGASNIWNRLGEWDGYVSDLQVEETATNPGFDSRIPQCPKAAPASPKPEPAPVSPGPSPDRVDEFVADYLGRFVDFDGQLGPQCVDLINFYNRDVVGARRGWAPAAYQLWDTADAGRYARIAPSEMPRKGDIAVWDAGFPPSNGAGHVAIVLSAGGGSFEALTQNPGEVKRHSFAYAYLRGFLRPTL